MRTMKTFGAILVFATSSLLGCAWFRSSVNNSPGFRWWLFSNFGARQICPRVLTSGIGLRFNSAGDIVGRFFPNRCDQRVDDTHQTVTVTFGGTGYAWTPIAGRVGFAANAAVEYRMDFRLTDDATYVYGVVASNPSPPQFQLGAIENKLVNWASKSPVGYVATAFGSQILSGEIAAGFTAIRSDSGDDFALGHLEPPARPRKPFGLSGKDRVLCASEIVELHGEQVNMAGPYSVAEADQAFYLRIQVDGPAIEGFVWPRNVIDPWREGLQTGTPLAPPPQPPLAQFALNPGANQVRVPLSPGSYIVVFDMSSQLGSVNPPFNPLNALGVGFCRVSFSVELGSADP